MPKLHWRSLISLAVSLSVFRPEDNNGTKERQRKFALQNKGFASLCCDY